MTGRPTAVKRARTIREVLLDHGVPEVSIELVPGRPTSGDVWNALDPVAAMSHHIASRPTPANPVPGLAVVTRGRAGLDGPLANGTAGVDLVYRIKTLGLANHPGYGGPYTVRGPLGAFTIPKDIARPYIWGTEYEGGYDDATWDRVYHNRRTGKAMTFREFMGRANAALVEAIWLPGISSRNLHDRITPGMDLSGYHLEHKTWAPGRKPDRHNYSTGKGRAELRRYAHQLQDQEDTDMPTAREIADAILDTPLNIHNPGGRAETQNITLREKHTADVIARLSGEDAAKAYLEAAGKSPVKKG
ncbi:hypothetical protein [Nocardioides pakistanensis]